MSFPCNSLRQLFYVNVVVICTLLTSHVNAESPPNVLFIAVDDLRGWLGHLDSNPQAKTPSIDRLAARGVSFARAYCSAPLCNPSRISLLTGIAPSRSGVYGNSEKLREKLPDAFTLMQHFRASGYRVVGGGKIFHGTRAYDQASWDDYFVPNRFPKRASPAHDESLPESAWTPWGALDIGDEEMFDGRVTQWVVSELSRSQDKPLFIGFGLTKPHLPWTVPRKYFDLYPIDQIALPNVFAGDINDLPEFGKRLAREVFDPSGEKDYAVPGGDHRNVVANGQWKIAVQAYLATISFADAQIGRVLDALDKSEHADDTLIVLWGDHGWHLGEKEHWRKHALWDVSTRTPLIFAFPASFTEFGSSSRGKVCRRPVSLIDLYPTLIELCGLPLREELDGQSLKPLLQNPTQEWKRPVQMTYGFKNHAIQTERWRYIEYRDGGQELYDHSSDPNEWNNLADLSDYRAVIDKLKSSLPSTNRK